MKLDESIKGMFNKFRDIISALEGLSKTFLISELVRKMLRSLPRLWEYKVTAIQEAKNLDTLKLQELIGSFEIH